MRRRGGIWWWVMGDGRCTMRAVYTVYSLCAYVLLWLRGFSCSLSRVVLPSCYPMGGSDADEGEVWRTFIPPSAILTILNASTTVRIRCDSTIFTVAAKISAARTPPQRFSVTDTRWLHLMDLDVRRYSFTGPMCARSAREMEDVMIVTKSAMIHDTGRGTIVDCARLDTRQQRRDMVQRQD